MGDVPAQNNLGIKYAYGKGVEVNYPEAVIWFTRAAEAGNAEAQGNLGLILRDGMGGVAQDYLAAAGWMALAGSQGHVASQSRLAWMFEKGLGMPKNMIEAARWFQMAADAGDLESTTHLGWLYETGAIGLTSSGKPDWVAALKWYQRAAAGNDASAQYHLGLLYRDGIGVAKNEAEARVWFKKAADQGYVIAQLNLEQLNAKPAELKQ
jgi:hypothetical protein